MGGQLNYFGLWLDENFGSGHSRGQPSCTTYGSPPLSAEEEFKIDRLEAWGVGVPPENLVSLCCLSLDSDSTNDDFIIGPVYTEKVVPGKKLTLILTLTRLPELPRVIQLFMHFLTKVGEWIT